MDRDDYAKGCAADFALFAAALKNHYLTARLGQSVSPATVGDFRLKALAANFSFINSVTERAKGYLLHMGAPETTAAVATHLAALRAIADKNAQTLCVRLMTPGNRLANLLVRDAGALGPLLAQKAEQIEFSAVDRAGRTWQAEKLVATLAREFAVNAYVDTQIAKLKEADIQQVQVTYPDPERAELNLVLNLDELPAHRKLLFHPNSTARLEVYVPA